MHGVNYESHDVLSDEGLRSESTPAYTCTLCYYYCSVLMINCINRFDKVEFGAT